MNRLWTSLAASLLLLAVATAPLRAANREMATVESAVEVAQALAGIPLKRIPPALLHDAKGVAIIPHVVKAGFLFDRRFGRGVVMMRLPNGAWSEPVFVTLSGSGVGLEAGVESADLVLVFKSEAALERILKGKGKLTLGGDVAVAAGPIGRDLETATDKWLKTEIFSYSRARGLFAGLSLEGDRIEVDAAANQAFYHLRTGVPEEVLSIHEAPKVIAVDHLKEHLKAMELPPPPLRERR